MTPASGPFSLNTLVSEVSIMRVELQQRPSVPGPGIMGLGVSAASIHSLSRVQEVRLLARAAPLSILSCFGELCAGLMNDLSVD